MVCFSDLPLEILPVILSHLQRPHHLFSTCLVNQTFLQFAVPKLYDTVYIYSWQKEVKTKVNRIYHAQARVCEP